MRQTYPPPPLNFGRRWGQVLLSLFVFTTLDSIQDLGGCHRNGPLTGGLPDNLLRKCNKWLMKRWDCLEADGRLVTRGDDGQRPNFSPFSKRRSIVFTWWRNKPSKQCLLFLCGKYLLQPQTNLWSSTSCGQLSKVTDSFSVSLLWVKWHMKSTQKMHLCVTTQVGDDDERMSAFSYNYL